MLRDFVYKIKKVNMEGEAYRCNIIMCVTASFTSPSPRTDKERCYIGCMAGSPSWSTVTTRHSFYANAVLLFSISYILRMCVWKLVQACHPFSSRLLKQWLVRPLFALLVFGGARTQFPLSVYSLFTISLLTTGDDQKRRRWATINEWVNKRTSEQSFAIASSTYARKKQAGGRFGWTGSSFILCKRQKQRLRCCERSKRTAGESSHKHKSKEDLTKN